MKKERVRDLVLLIGAAAIILVLWAAPEETTHRVPADETHRPYYEIVSKEGKKAAEQHCEKCHNEQDVAFPADHPAKARCLLCHKLEQQ